MQGDWVVAIATVLAATVTGVIGYLIARYQATRRAIRFYIDESQDLAGALKSRGQFFEVKIGEQITQELIASEVIVSNEGNVVLENVVFKLIIPGPRRLAKTSVTSANSALAQKVQIDFPALPPTDPYFTYTLPFFNPAERFSISCFFDGPITSCEVSCRLPSVAVEIITKAQREANAKRFAFRWTAALAIVIAASIIFQIFFLFKTDRIVPSGSSSPTPDIQRQTPCPCRKPRPLANEVESDDAAVR